ncbi:PDZ domain-containing protein [Algoriphagus sp. D3-2-R+10]|uniref:S41 family peptidase n=1 Tax=Algoriphagus aurantiacus TaxID=3103948 RepID=UPI002B3E5A0F|nr:PDZ domain-containing protein [Algoriphagus sp. D3-2-R+10]MEB2777199.1 PDZ domain-containing protein [Algoriphagus sp. D3-2-R+10]
MRKFILGLSILTAPLLSQAQTDARLMQLPDVSETQITFTYGDDIWVVPKQGGVAQRLTSPAGPEMYPRFSPDGNQIAFSANYNGNYDVYVMPTSGGVPTRLTYHGMPNVVQGWTPDGKSVLFTSGRESGKERFSQFYTVSSTGGLPAKLPVPYGEFASYSPDGKRFAYTDRSRVNRNWKRYRGGTAPDILLFDLVDYKTENITNNTANDELPMWIGDAVYYMSDNGPEQRNNLWKYDLTSKQNTQLTEFKDFDITFPSNSEKEIVFEAGGSLYLYDIASGEAKRVGIQIISDQKAMIPKIVSLESDLMAASLSPDGNRVIANARGELFNLPAKEGFVTNLTNTSGVAERYPEIAPDAKKIAYWSDATGEYQLTIKTLGVDSQTKTLTNFKDGFGYNIFWSPDSKKIVSVNQAMEVLLIDAVSGDVQVIDNGKYMFEGSLRGFGVSWSPDSRYISYSLSKNNRATSTLFVFDTKSGKTSQITSGFYADQSPTFSEDGKYLFFRTNRNFDPQYSDIDNTFIYSNTTGVAVGTLNQSIPSLISLKNDEIKVEEEKSDKEDDKKDDKKEEPESVEFETSSFENRIEMLEIPNGNIGGLATLEGKLLYVRHPNTGVGEDSKSSLQLYDLEDKESKTVIDGVNGFSLSADRKKVMVFSMGKLAVIDPAPDQKIEETVPLGDMQMTVVPAEEWKQIFNDVWRFERDYFYDPNMHGVDWELMRKRYGDLVAQAGSRRDVNIIIGDLIAELNASHTYNGGGDLESGPTLSVGYLGANFELENGAYKIEKIIQGAPWDVEVRSPLLKSGVEVKEGDYILAINGQAIDTNKSIYAALQGLAGKTIQLTVNSSASMTGAKTFLVEPLGSEARLRNLAWINDFRKRVEEATDGRIGYIFVPSTGVDGQNELFRQFYGQMEKEGMIIDERFNNGGQIPDRFVELLDRKPLAFWAVRDGEDWAWPQSGNFGPKVMLINGFAGSGGDAFPDYFRKREIGPLIGTRTWGGLIGISGAPSLIDGGSVTVPTFRMYDPDGTWFKEGHGVDPDIEVVEDFESLAKGTDAQLEAAIQEVMRLLNSSDRFKVPARPGYEKR